MSLQEASKFVIIICLLRFRLQILVALLALSCWQERTLISLYGFVTIIIRMILYRVGGYHVVLKVGREITKQLIANFIIITKEALF